MRYNIYENGGAVEGLVTISGMTVTGYIRLRHNPVEDMEAASKQYVDSLLVLLDSNSVKQGVFDKARLPTFTGGQVTSVAGNNVLAITPTGVAPNTYTKITVGVNGLVTSGSNLTPADIPSISFSKITTGKPTTLAGYGIVDGVSRVNGAITGNLTLSGTPIAATDVATKQYTDNKTLNNKTYQTGDLITGSYDTPPTGFLRCNGAEVSKTTYAALYGVIGDLFGGSGSSDLSVGSGKPWKQQYEINTEQSTDITGWVGGTSLPEPLTGSQAIVTKNRVYLLGGSSDGSIVSTVYTAPINEDGTLGTWTRGTSLPEPLAHSQAIATTNRVYLLGGYNGSPQSTVYNAPINEDGTLGTWGEGPNLPVPLAGSQAIVTKNRVYLINGSVGDGYVTTVCTAPINEDGTLGAWTIDPGLPGPLEESQAIVTKNRVYLLGGSVGDGIESTVYTAPINEDGTIGAWTTGTSLPEPLAGSQAIVTTNRVYLLGGSSTTGTVSTVYTAPINEDGTLGVWTTGPSLPETLRKSQAIVTTNRVYLLGGYNSDGYVSKIYTAPINEDGTLGTWATIPSLPEGLGISQAIVTKNRVYLLGGSSTSGAVSTVYTAPINEDGTLGAWGEGPSLPEPLGYSQAIVTKNRVYLLGGWSNSGIVSTVHTAPINEDGALGTWNIGPNLPEPLAGSQAIVTKNRVYLLGGYDVGYTSVSTVYTAPINEDGTIGTWTTGTSLPGALSDSQTIVTKNRVYLLGGWDGSDTVSTVYTAPVNADGTLGAWTTGTSLPGALVGSQAIVTKNRVYLLGGYGSGAVSTVYTAPINEDGTIGTWATGTNLPGSLNSSQAIVTKNRVYLLGGYIGGYNGDTLSTIYTAPFAGGMNDYSSYYNGTVVAGGGTGFRLPDYTSTTDPVGKVFVKF